MIKVIESHLIYASDYFELYEDLIKAEDTIIGENLEGNKDKIKTYQRINIPNENVVIVPIFSDGSLLMIEIYRYQLDKALLELPSGTIEKKEEPLDTARKELLEETGYQAKTLEYSGWFYTWPSKMNQKVHDFVAKELQKVSGQNLEEGEEIKVKIITKDELTSKLKSNEIKTSITISALLRGYFL